MKLQYSIAWAVKYILLGRKGLQAEDVHRQLGDIRRVVRITVKNFLFERKGTYCPKLWDSAFVDQFGNVFSCCFSRPGAVGNLYQNDMATIWRRSLRLKFFRWMSLHKCLYCAHNCRLITEEEKSRTVPPQHLTNHPIDVWILYGERCNLNCVMCWQDHHDKLTIDNAVVKNNVNWTEVENIELQGGEVLAMKEAKALFLWLTQEKKKKVNLITNGMLINDRWARYLVSGSQRVHISVNAASKEIHERVNRGSKFTRVINNIKTLVRLKQEMASDVKIIYKYTIVPDNIHEVAEAITYADSLGCDRIAFGYDVAVPVFLATHGEVKSKIRDQLQRLVNAKLAIEIDPSRLIQLGLLDSHGKARVLGGGGVN